MRQCRQHATDFPGYPDAFALVSLGPEEIEEECATEDEGHEHACENIVRGGTDIIIVIHVGLVVLRMDEVLLVNVVYERRQSDGPYFGCPWCLLDRAEVPNDSETTQNMRAHW